MRARVAVLAVVMAGAVSCGSKHRVLVRNGSLSKVQVRIGEETADIAPNQVRSYHPGGGDIPIFATGPDVSVDDSMSLPDTGCGGSGRQVIVNLGLKEDLALVEAGYGTHKTDVRRIRG